MNNKISFSGLITTITEDAHTSSSYTRNFVNEMALIIRDGLLRDGTVTLSGFGIFKLRDVPQRTGRNIRTGQPLVIPTHRKVMFKPEKSLREQINKRYGHLRSQLIDPARASGIDAHAQKTPDRDISGSFFSTVFTEENETGTNEQKSGPENIAVDKKPVAGNASPSSRGPGTVTSDLNQKDTDKSLPLEKTTGALRKPALYFSVLTILIVLFFYIQTQTDDDTQDIMADQAKVNHPAPAPTVASKTDQPANETKTQSGNVKKTAPVHTAKAVAGQKIKVYKQVTRHTKFGDNLWKLASHHYHDGYLWPLILLQNHDKIKNPDFVKTGMNLVVPALSIKNNKLDKATLTRLAKGHILAYTSFKALGRDEALNHLYAANKYDPDYVRSIARQIDNKDLIAIH